MFSKRWIWHVILINRGRYFIFETGHNRLNSHFLTEGSFVLGICTLHTVFPSPIQGCDEDNCVCHTCTFVPCLVFTGEKGLESEWTACCLRLYFYIIMSSIENWFCMYKVYWRYDISIIIDNSWNKLGILVVHVFFSQTLTCYKLDRNIFLAVYHVFIKA